MNENVRMPIKTVRDGNKITKVCVEDIYKMLKRIGIAEERSTKKWNEVWDSVDKELTDANGNTVNGCLIIGTGISQPNIKDAFDENIGNNIAFMKAKLNANFKKRNVLLKLWNSVMITIDAIDDEIYKLDNMIGMDLYNLRKHNPAYLEKLDDFGYEIQEETEKSGSQN